MKRRKKILFFAEGITMTHFVRPAALAETLDPAEWEIYFWTPRRYHPLLRGTFSGLGDLPTLDLEDFLDALAHMRPDHTTETLRGYVEKDLAIIKEIRPDFMIGDHRLSLSITASVCGVPFASIINAHWSPYWKLPAIVPELPVTRWVAPALLNPIFWAVRPALFARKVNLVNDVRRSFDLPAIPRNLRRIYTAGNLVLYPDVPELVPLSSLPPHHYFVGTCPWAPATPKPAWWSEVMGSSVPKIFVSLGSSGPLKVLRSVLEAATSLPVKVVLSTSGRPVGPIPANVHVAELLPYEETARHSAVVVSHGGTGGLYPTLAAGTPMLAIPSTLDNHLSTAWLKKNGAGIGVRAEYASRPILRRTLERLLSETRFRKAAQNCAVAIKRHDTKKIFPDVLRRWFAQ